MASQKGAKVVPMEELLDKRLQKEQDDFDKIEEQRRRWKNRNPRWQAFLNSFPNNEILEKLAEIWHSHGNAMIILPFKTREGYQWFLENCEIAFGTNSPTPRMLTEYVNPTEYIHSETTVEPGARFYFHEVRDQTSGELTLYIRTKNQTTTLPIPV